MLNICFHAYALINNAILTKLYIKACQMPTNLYLIYLCIKILDINVVLKTNTYN